MIAVIGAGALGTALAVALRRAGQEVSICATAFDDVFLDARRRGEPHPALGVPFPDVDVYEHGAWALADAEIVVLAVSTAGLVATISDALDDARPDALWAVGTKGWDHDTLRSASAVVADALGDEKRVVALVGPSLAAELAAGVPTALAFACTDRDNAVRVAHAFSSDRLQAYLTDDVIGVEVGAALKNVIAIGIGMCEGVMFDAPSLMNTKAFLFARALAELAALARALGGRVETVLGLAGAGDLFVSVIGGRNARFGALIGDGMTPEEALKKMDTTVEGYANGQAAVALADRHGLRMPIIRAVASVLYEGVAPRDAIEELFSGTTAEDEF